MSSNNSRAARWYVFYVPPGREPAVFGGKSGWKHPKRYWGPFEERSEAVRMAYVQAANDGVRGKAIASQYRVKRLTDAQFVKVWGNSPGEEFHLVTVDAESHSARAKRMRGPKRKTSTFTKVVAAAGVVGAVAFLANRYK